MPVTDYQSSSSFSFSRQVNSMDPNEPATSAELESFQRQVATLFQSLASVPAETLLSLSWLRDLLDAFLCCQEEFRMILFNNKDSLNKPPIEKTLSDYFERSVKALDVCNAVRDGIGQIKQWEKQLEIIKSALNQEENKNLNESHIRRAKKALIDLAISMLDEKDSKTTISHRNRSFGRNNVQKDKNLGHFRSLSWSVSPNWSASKQIQAIGNLSIPKNNDGLAIAVFTMSWVLYFVMWVLVAAIPCQDRGLLHTNFNIPKNFVWAGAVLSLHDRILEESKRRERRSACGLMKEIRRVEICARVMNELTDSVLFPVSEEREGEVRERVREVGEVLEAVKDGLGPLESGVREAFRRIVRSRTQGLDSLGNKY